MLKSLEIKNFRCFESFRLEKLGQVNLLVGSNNSGKTSRLEALYLLCYPASLESLCNIMIDRGEYIFNDEPREQMTNSRELDVRHLFYNHEIQENMEIVILGKDNNLQEEKVVLLVTKDTERHQQINMGEYLFPVELLIDWVNQK